ncbi:MAG: peptidase [Deltaproteobacteria bacterium]|nr:peptidase [Deltaproteobacteria bacterium]
MQRLVLGMLVACGSGIADPADRAPRAVASPQPAVAATAARPAVAEVVTPVTPSCVEDGKPYDEAVMRERITLLASKGLDGRAPGSDGDVTTRKFITERFDCLGLTKAGASFELPFTTGGQHTANVVGYVKGSDATLGSEIVLVAAHHDHLGGGYLGANDNASGLVALLSIAQAVQQHAPRPRRTIVFAAFGAEEGGMLGSYEYAKTPPAALPLDKIMQVVNLDMVGSYSSRKLVAAMGAFKGFAARKLLDQLDRGFPKLNVSSGGRARGSDFEPFCKLGVPYVFFWTPDARCYHEKCDTADQVDYPHMVEISRLAGALTRELADTDVDLAAARKKLGCGVAY